MLRPVLLLGSAIAAVSIIPVSIVVLPVPLLILVLLLAAVFLPIIDQIRSSVALILVLVVGVVVLLVLVGPILLEIALCPSPRDDSSSEPRRGPPPDRPGSCWEGDSTAIVRTPATYRRSGSATWDVSTETVVSGWFFQSGRWSTTDSMTGSLVAIVTGPAALRPPSGRVLVITFTRRFVVCHGARSCSGWDPVLGASMGRTGGYSWIF